jgi:hypothetical protein
MKITSLKKILLSSSLLFGPLFLNCWAIEESGDIEQRVSVLKRLRWNENTTLTKQTEKWDDNYHLLTQATLTFQDNLSENLKWRVTLLGRHSQSDFYREENKLSQNLFKFFLLRPYNLSNSSYFPWTSNFPAPHKTENYKSELTIQEFYLEKNFPSNMDFKLKAGRFPLTFGQGEFFNLINPFIATSGWQPGRTVMNTQDLVLGQMSPDSRIKVELMGIVHKENALNEPSHLKVFPWLYINGQFDEYPGKPSVSLVGGISAIRSEFNSQTLKLNELQRKKYLGLEFLFQLEESLMWLSFNHQREQLGQKSHLEKSFSQVSFGFDQQLDSLWSLHIEMVKTFEEKKNQGLNFNLITFMQSFQVHPLIKYRNILLLNPSSDYLVMINRGEFSLMDSLDCQVSLTTPLLTNARKMSVLETLTPYEFTTGLIYYF